MKSIAISIDEPTLKQLDDLTAASARPRSRSALVRIAVREFAERERRRQTDSQETQVIRKHRRRLAQQARALVDAQAKP
jgi:metal-responsive CopG/Arc/MetJ family transcriptional regulator